MSWKPEVIADSSGKWVSNALRFATEKEAYGNVCDLAGRWMLVHEWRAVECDDPVTHKWVDGGLVNLPLPPCQLWLNSLGAAEWKDMCNEGYAAVAEYAWDAAVKSLNR